MKKRLFAMIVAIFTLFCLTVNVISSDVIYTFMIDSREVVVFGDDMSYDEALYIADYIIDNNTNDAISTCGIICTLLGHNLSSSTVVEIVHNVYSTSPKCVRYYYQVYTCSRCDYISKELERTVRISGCH